MTDQSPSIERNTIDRFTDRVENYIRYRPLYPEKVVELFQNLFGAGRQTIIADIGCGPGHSSIGFLKAGLEVIGVEPNDVMRRAATEFCKDYTRFTVVAGTAENTGLNDHSVDIVLAAQAFHWFDRKRTRSEFERILRKNGWIVLMWNERQLDTTPFLREYEMALKEFGTDYEAVRHDKLGAAELEDFFGGRPETVVFPNVQRLDLEGFLGRAFSSSYVPSQQSEMGKELESKLRKLFDNYQQEGRIEIFYDTKVFYKQY